jgi:hypothetical protein
MVTFKFKWHLTFKRHHTICLRKPNYTLTLSHSPHQYTYKQPHTLTLTHQYTYKQPHTHTHSHINTHTNSHTPTLILTNKPIQHSLSHKHTHTRTPAHTHRLLYSQTNLYKTHIQTHYLSLTQTHRHTHTHFNLVVLYSHMSFTPYFVFSEYLRNILNDLFHNQKC